MNTTTAFWAGVVAACAGGLISGPAFAQEPASAAVGRIVEEIVVTARKREENVQDVPLSVSVLSGDFLEQSGAITLDDVARYAPNFSTAQATQSPRNQRLVIRGIGSETSNGGIEPSVGTFVDGVYQGRPAMVSGELIDIERIEVLRGPQGTLFGKNTPAGAINITTRRPGFEPEFALDATVGRFDQRSLKALIGGPLAGDRAAYRATLYRHVRDGWVDNVVRDTDINEIDRWGGRAKVLVDLADNLELLLTADYTRDEMQWGATDLTDIAPQFPALVGFLESLDGIERPFGSDLFAYESWHDHTDYNERTVYGTSAELEYETEGHVWNSITSWRGFEWNHDRDFDFSSLDLFIALLDEDQHQFSQELRVASTGSRTIDYVAGLYYFEQGLENTATTGTGRDFEILTGGFIPAGSAFDATVDETTRSYSGFGQVTWHVSAKVEIAAGARYTYEEKEHQRFQAPSFALPPFDDTLTRDEDAVSGNLSVQYRWNDDVMTYLTLARGFKAGGFTAFPTNRLEAVEFDEEESNTVEAGIKSQWLDGRVVANLTLFHTDYDNLQLSVYDGISFIIGNAAAATTKGLELEVRAAVSERLRVLASAGYTDAEYDEFENAPCSAQDPLAGPGCTQDLSGERVFNAPEWTVNLSVDYAHPLPFGATEGYVRADWQYTGDQYLDIDLDDNTFQDAYTLVNAKAGIRAASGRWDVSLWARNLLDEEYATVLLDTAAQFGPSYMGSAGEPRTVGLQGRVWF